MSLQFKFECADIVWDRVPEILKTVGMSYHDAEIHRKTF